MNQITQKELEKMMEEELCNEGANFDSWYIDDDFGTVSGAMAKVLTRLGFTVIDD